MTKEKERYIIIFNKEIKNNKNHQEKPRDWLYDVSATYLIDVVLIPDRWKILILYPTLLLDGNRDFFYINKTGGIL